MTEQDKALDKIRRLLNLGKSSNEHEAQSALVKAAELARRHSIDLGCVQASVERARIIERTFETEGTLAMVEKAARLLCCALFSCDCLSTLTYATYVGLPHNVDAAVYAHAFVVEQCGRDLALYRRAQPRRRLSKGAVYSYCLGWVIGVKHRYEAELATVKPQAQLEDSRTALILHDQRRELDDYMNSHHGGAAQEKTSKRIKHNGSALNAGLEAGAQVSINRPLMPAQQMLRLQ